MFKYILTALFIAAPMMANASEGSGGGSEFFHQAEGGKHQITPGLLYVSSSQEIGGAGKDKTSGFLLNFEYEYGVMPELAVGAAIGFKSFSNDLASGADTDTSGLTDLELLVKGTMPAGPGALKYGATLGISPGDAEVKSNGDRNAYSGGMELTPYVGYEYSMAPCVMGAKLSVDIGLSDRTTDSSGTKTKESGADETTIALFYEHEFSSDMKLGGELDWVTTSDTKDEDTGAKTENISPTQKLRVYMPMTMGNGTLIPEFTYGFTTDDKVGGADIDSYSLMALGASYRMAF